MATANKEDVVINPAETETLANTDTIQTEQDNNDHQNDGKQEICNSCCSDPVQCML